MSLFKKIVIVLVISWVLTLAYYADIDSNGNAAPSFPEWAVGLYWICLLLSLFFQAVFEIYGYVRGGRAAGLSIGRIVGGVFAEKRLFIAAKWLLIMNIIMVLTIVGLEGKTKGLWLLGALEAIIPFVVMFLVVLPVYVAVKVVNLIRR